jgi:LysM repeat protein
VTQATPSADKIYKIAAGEVGYHEGSNNSNKYAAVVGVPNNQAWCTTFASWLFIQANLKSLCLMSDYSVDQYNWFKSKGRSSAYPAVGAVVWFGPGAENHTGWVYAYDADNIYTIEGNFNNEVNFHVRSRRDDIASIGAVYAYGYPAFAEGIVTADPNHTVAGSVYAATASVNKTGDTPPVTTPPADGGGTTTTVPGKTYVVKSGDTWASIASANGVALADVLALNGVKPAVGATIKVTADTTTTTPPPPSTDYTVFPGAGSFTLGATNGYVQQLTTWLLARGGTVPVTSTFTTVVQSEVAAFQAAQGWSGSDADGIPGATSWGMLKNHTGSDIPPVGGGTGGTTTPPTSYVSSVAINDKTGVSYARYTGSMSVASAVAGALAARGITGSTAVANWTKGMTTIIGRESSGDWNACNRNDSNNKTPSGYSMVADYGNGYPGGNLNGALTNYQCSRGGAQCIPQTFAANHCPGTSNMIYDPVANVAASIGYIRAEYGVALDGSNLASKVQQADPNRSPSGY